MSSSDQAAIGLIFTRPNASSNEISGAFARVGDSTRRMPVTQAEYPFSALRSGSTLRIAAARDRVAGEQVLAVQLVLLGDGVLGRDVDHVDAVHGLDRVAGADGLGEVVAGVQEQHVDAGANLGRHVDQHRVLHVGGHDVSTPEVSSVQRSSSSAPAFASSEAPRRRAP